MPPGKGYPKKRKTKVKTKVKRKGPPTRAEVARLERLILQNARGTGHLRKQVVKNSKRVANNTRRISTNQKKKNGKKKNGKK
tara:strand:+ start:435 stop:680 length:246 start_codon:yes stop_codon:yes gene_type:complete